MPGPGEGCEGRHGGRQGADDDIRQRHVADVHVGPGLQHPAPGWDSDSCWFITFLLLPEDCKDNQNVSSDSNGHY